MSAYAAVVSLLQILETILHSGQMRIIHNRPQLHSLYDKVILFLDFLENSSSTYKAPRISALETKMREAAYEAEDLLESQISGISSSESRRLRVLMVVTILNFFYSSFILSMRFHAASPAVVMLDRAKIFAIMICTLAFAATLVFTIPFYGMFLALQVQASNFSLINGGEGDETPALRKVLYNMSYLAKEAIRIKEAGLDVDVPAYAALVSLKKILDSILLDSSPFHNREQLDSLHEKVSFLLDFLGNVDMEELRESAGFGVEIPEAAIRDAAHKAQELIEFQIPAEFIQDSDRRVFRRSVMLMLIALLSSVSAIAISTTIHVSVQLLVGWFVIVALGFGALALGTRGVEVILTGVDHHGSETQEDQKLSLVIDDLSIMVQEVNEFKDSRGTLPPPPPPLPLPGGAAAVSSSTRKDKNAVVGLEKDMEQIKDRLLQDSSKLEVISIVGMGGIGKTTLATQVYDDPDIAYYFDVRAWVTVSQEYSLRHVLLRLLDSANIRLPNWMHEDDERLGEHLYRNLKGRRHLIVMDDMWDVVVWDTLARFIPDDCNGSRVLLTSRLSDVASYPDFHSPLHQMQCLDKYQSWCLLRDKVFGSEEEECPFELESIGMEIAKRCRGLPLAILVIGGLLYKEKRSKRIWKQVAENLKLKLRQTEEQCLEILGLSYNHLPRHLRPCFLYMAVLPRDYEIPISRLTNLWIAEGFLKPSKSKTLEEVAEGYVEDLVDRNLILVCTRSCNGKIRTCSIHDLLRDVCVENARKEKIFHVMDGDGGVHVNRDRPPRRLSIQPDAAQQVNASITSYHTLRSFLCSASKLLDNHSSLYLGFVYLRVLDVLALHFSKLPHQITELVYLRYLAFHYDGPLPPSMSKLHNLETIVHHHCSLGKYPLLPRVIWSMPSLRHLYAKPGCYLSDPLGYCLSWKSSVLENLHTLVGIRNFKWSKGITKRIPNLKKLGISYEVSSSVDWSRYQLESLVDLHQLEALKITVEYNDRGSDTSHTLPPKLAFPHNLKKLSLNGCGIPWTAICALPNVEALKLRSSACCGETWQTVEGGFPKLVFLLLEFVQLTWWETDAAHLPRLERLVVRSCDVLEEIPCAIGDIPTLEVIELVDCHPCAVESARRIQEEQESMGNVDLKVRICSSNYL